MKNFTFYDSENACQNIFASGGPYWHFCTDGACQEIIFTTREDFVAAMNIIAIVLVGLNVKIIAFILMNNHVHFILEGEEQDCKLFFERFTKRLDHYFSKIGRYGILSSFYKFEKPLPICDISQLRNEIVYVHRNMYVARRDVLPFNYQWSSCRNYFNPVFEGKITTPFSKMPYLWKREKVFQGRVSELPENYICSKDYIIPESYIDTDRGESFFRNASHYFTLLTKAYEEYSLVAKHLGDNQCLNYEEVYSAAVAISKEKYHTHIPQSLPFDAKKDVAHTLHYDYHIPNDRISTILKLDKMIVDQLFR